MTGMRPDSLGSPAITALSQQPPRRPHPTTVLQTVRYHAAAIGKIYHGVFLDGASITKWDTMDPQSWSVPAVRFGPRYYYTEDASLQDGPMNSLPTENPARRLTRSWWAQPNPPMCPIIPFTTARLLMLQTTLRELKGQGNHFLALGFIKPHSPYILRKVFDLIRIRSYQTKWHFQATLQTSQGTFR